MDEDTGPEGSVKQEMDHDGGRPDNPSMRDDGQKDGGGDPDDRNKEPLDDRGGGGDGEGDGEDFERSRDREHDRDRDRDHDDAERNGRGDGGGGAGSVDEGGGEMRAVFFGNLSHDCRVHDIIDVFERPVVGVGDGDQGRGVAVERVDLKRGFAFVFLKDAANAEEKMRAERYVSQINGMQIDRVSKALRSEFARGDGLIKKKEDDRRKRIQPSETLFVVNFQEETTKREDLHRLFEPYGPLVRIDMKRNYAFVQFTNVEDARRAKDATNNGKLDQSVITVEYVARRMGDRGPRDRDDRPPHRRDRGPVGGGPYGSRPGGPPEYGRGGYRGGRDDRGYEDRGRGGRDDRPHDDFRGGGGGGFRGRDRSPPAGMRDRDYGDRRFGPGGGGGGGGYNDRGRGRSRSRSRSPPMYRKSRSPSPGHRYRDDYGRGGVPPGGGRAGGGGGGGPDSFEYRGGGDRDYRDMGPPRGGAGGGDRDRGDRDRGYRSERGYDDGGR